MLYEELYQSITLFIKYLIMLLRSITYENPLADQNSESFGRNGHRVTLHK